MEALVAIIAPTQGKDINSFLSVAQEISRSVYRDSIILRTKVVDADGRAVVEFSRAGGAFQWDNWNQTKLLRRVVIISHALLDGPNLAFGDASVPDDLHQPWGTNGGELTDEGKSFWQMVGRKMDNDGKIILLGCLQGGGGFANNVAAAARTTVYAAKNFFGAGDAAIALRAVKAVESGHRGALTCFSRP